MQSCCRMEEVDWDKGLPIDILAMIAGGRDAQKSMRGVSQTWKEGFDRSVDRLKIRLHGPDLGLVPVRFPMLTSLDLGGSPMGELRLQVR